ncbi:hypothetical protein LRX75_11820 [Rhizobium sp. DKSPLA3]|uniref:Uncharacterized protein n=1 Tax=Rhizobium quercicola TaxID=2901226 RepID=A0A9X1NRK9_9HYPH|nr:hypothetical protein [Rhizobium quercicola]MCD7109725.1 hypothetical protein [Rhizobium quercicola]
MSRIRTAEQSSRRETAKARNATLTLVADSCAPADLKARSDHYRRHLADANRVIETLQIRVSGLERERDEIRSRAHYDLSLCVTRGEAERERLAAFRLARGKAAILAEDSDGVPNALSNAIDQIPDPKPKWINNDFV